MTDVYIAVALALLAAAMGYMGVHLTMHPAHTPKARLTYKTSFASIALLSCALIGIQAYRGVIGQKQLSKALESLRNEATKTRSDVSAIRSEGAEKNKNAENRRAIREHLGKLIAEGNALKDRAAYNSLAPQFLSDWKHWEVKVERYLNENLGRSYGARFDSVHTPGVIPLQIIGGEISKLEEFLRELKD